MRMIQLVVDSCADTPENGWEGFSQVPRIVPLSFTIGDSSFTDGDLSLSQYLNLLDRRQCTTSAPSPQQFFNVFQEIVLAGNKALYIAISSEFSSTYNNALLAASDFGDKVAVIDSRGVSLAIYYLAKLADSLISSGLDLAEIIPELKNAAERVTCYLLLKTTKYLYKGGRASYLQYHLSALLDIKLLLRTDSTGKLELMAKFRGWTRAKQGLIEAVLQGGTIKSGGAIHIENREEAIEIITELQRSSKIPLEVAESGLVIATHTGTDALGFVVFR